MNYLLKASLFTLFSLCTLSAKEVVQIFQNGLNNYTGCSDSYLYRVGATPSTVEMNFGRAELLKSAN